MINRLATLIKFGIVGVMNTAVDALVFTMLAALGTPALIAQVISYSCGVLNSYWWNGRWTFRDARRQGANNELMRFVITNLIVLALSSLILFLSDNILGLNLVISKAAATLLGMILNYIASRYWVFRAVSATAAYPSTDANERSVS
ncbi:MULTISPECIES: GtrA family protein [Paenibacillus]|uniref:GtrA family protein n=1 Tax=Paenibacillus illinoisensis TaxID=59845 RepID=UPI001C8D205D|nr:MULTISPECIES: GtrA family protein [Paenibacillus]MBY0219032.1 GtrA family protein [Paenibacillus illinoisensis]WJH29725.1 GtrA family protein [Paenibacillus sp. CC-CFT742]